MINLTNLEVNDEILIYVNTMDSDIPYDTNNFLFGFKGGFTNVWTFVIPEIVTQNTRYTKFSITLVPSSQEDPANSLVTLGPEGNFDYKLWAIDQLTLDPAYGYLIDEGQAYLEDKGNEMETITYISNNEAEKNIVYLTRSEEDCLVWNKAADLWQLANTKWNDCN